ncbi:MAG: hypothetical protein WDZ62_02205 [Candidatus Pacearchaeota archaeon]
MKFLLNKLRQNFELYNSIKKIYGNTVGLWWLKEFYIKYFGIYNGRKKLKLLSEGEGDKLISDKIKSGKPFMLARYGSTEFKNITGDKHFDLLCFYSGFFPNDKSLLKKFQKSYFESSKQIDILAVWNYKMHFLKKLRLVKKFPNIENIVPLSVAGGINNNWRNELKNKKVLVVHPFKKTIEEQMKKRKELGILPEVKKLEVIKAVQTIAGNHDKRFKDWFEALDYMKKEIDKKIKNFDIVIIGCGAYGLPLAAHVKQKGKQALHLAGGTQLLFGIKGKRWENSKTIKFNEYWTYPLEEDKIENLKKIEGGAYW